MPDDDEDGERVAAAPRSFWSGTLTFGLVSIPVDLYSVSRSVRPSLRMLAPDGTPLQRIYVCPEHEREVEPEEITRGYPLGEGRYVVVTDEELDALQPEKSRDIHLRRFVPREQIPPAFFRRSYVLAPSGASTRAYAVLAQTMEEGSRAGIATFVMRGKEYLVAIMAQDGILNAETLRFRDELRGASEVGLPEATEPPAKMVRAMQKAVAKASRDGVPKGALTDRRSAAIEELAQAKKKRGQGVVELEEADAEEPATAEAPDLIELLKRRLAAEDGGEERPRRAAKQASRKSGRKTGGDDGGRASDRGGASNGGRDELAGRSKQELYERAKELDIEGRSRMSKDELVRAIRAAS